MGRQRGIFSAWGLVLGISLIAGCGGMDMSTAPPAAAIATQTIASGFTAPLDIEQPGDNSGRLFVVEQGGTIKIIQNGAVLGQPFLNISAKVINQVEMGLLGLSFHPSFSSNRKFYVNYVRNSAGQFQSVIAEYLVSAADPNQADPASERILLTVDQVNNFTNHKAGQLAFGADGFLYFGLGDGGSGGDPLGHGQSTQTLLGKMMRIDVNATSAGKQYAIPADNPFVAGGGLPEIYAIGFRNPWRFSFDRPSGRLFVADVGQDKFEEIDIVQKGGNYGWNTMEGAHCFNPPSGCNMTGLALPIIEIGHPEGEAVIGGFIYHGTALTGRQGMYIFGDLNGQIWSLTENPANTFTRTLLLKPGFNLSSFGQDSNGELYVADLGGGRVLKIVPQ
ncbi:MAG TPA: PQQ-dependent sugar dehydrogenase [Candidatus Sulfotelmatobacter sp.]|nr:PQQ-dependent sugar dehydrogenase [Candidatus Sulfotelmatobacter sp.]